ncbi:hypothetical protein JZ785_24895 [Alicyclobacillus curvatus]|nr:hypothetical protein JZ785_24895 [Alicyclobacillus curvatus]
MFQVHADGLPRGVLPVLPVLPVGTGVVSGQWSVVSGQWSVVSGQWSVVSGQWSVVSGHRSSVSVQSRNPAPAAPPLQHASPSRRAAPALPHRNACAARGSV